LSAIVGVDVAAATTRLRAFNESHRGKLVVDVVELRSLPLDRFAAAVSELPSDLLSYVELPAPGDPTSALLTIRASGARAKVRTGGITEEAFPIATQLARFIGRCVELDIPFKATAGLHHPLTGDYPLTYAPDAPRARMFGFLNVFVAAAFARTGMSEAMIVDVLEESDPEAFEFAEHSLRWRERSLSEDQIAATRSSLATSFGSCSFEEPVDGLRAMGLL
jgi:hypothetical protein